MRIRYLSLRHHQAPLVPDFVPVETFDRYRLADLILSPKDFGIKPAA